MGESTVYPKDAKSNVENSKFENSIFVGNLSWEATEKIIDDMITDLIGPNLVNKIRIGIDKITGKVKGFCHIDFKTSEAAQKAIKELNEIVLLGRNLIAAKARSPPIKMRSLESNNTISFKYKRSPSNLFAVLKNDEILLDSYAMEDGLMRPSNNQTICANGVVLRPAEEIK